MTTITIPIEGMRLGAALNARVHWSKRAARAKKERAVVAVALRSQWFPDVETASPPTTCTLVRVAPRALDDDNLAGAFKSIRDEVAAFFGVDDGPKEPIAWRYEQRREAPKQYCVEIRLTWGDKVTTKHTPGPWTAHPRSSDGAEVRSLAQVAWCGAAAAYGESGNQTIDAAEACANARLIAAAPDLLAACEALLAGSSKAAPLARIAIAKAKGEKA